jgi:hypothetical protein
MTVREAATYLGYVVLFAAVVAWGFLLHSPKAGPAEAEYGHSTRVVSDAPPAPAQPPIADGQVRQAAAAVAR